VDILCVSGLRPVAPSRHRTAQRQLDAINSRSRPTAYIAASAHVDSLPPRAEMSVDQVNQRLKALCSKRGAAARLVGQSVDHQCIWFEKAASGSTAAVTDSCELRHSPLGATQYRFAAKLLSQFRFSGVNRATKKSRTTNSTRPRGGRLSRRIPAHERPIADPSTRHPGVTICPVCRDRTG
jgi:hypothetical protein